MARKKNLKNQLRCENCNRLTHVDNEMWENLIEDPYMVFLCDRPTCKKVSDEMFTNTSRTLKIYTKSSYISELEKTYTE